MKRRDIFVGLLAIGAILVGDPQVVKAESGYIGTSVSDNFDEDGTAQVNAELVVPVTDYLEGRLTTNFNNELNVLPTLSVDLGNVADLYAGAGLNLRNEKSNLLLRTGIDWNLGENFVGISYLDYTDNDLTGAVGMGYRFSGLTQSTSLPTSEEVILPRDRN